MVHRRGTATTTKPRRGRERAELKRLIFLLYALRRIGHAVPAFNQVLGRPTMWKRLLGLAGGAPLPAGAPVNESPPPSENSPCFFTLSPPGAGFPARVA